MSSTKVQEIKEDINYFIEKLYKLKFGLNSKKEMIDQIYLGLVKKFFKNIIIIVL